MSTVPADLFSSYIAISVWLSCTPVWKLFLTLGSVLLVFSAVIAFEWIFIISSKICYWNYFTAIALLYRQKMSFHLVNGAVRANLISLAIFACEISHCNSGCLSVGKVFFPAEISIITYSWVNDLMSYFCKKRHTYFKYVSIPFVIRTFGFQF